MKQNALKTDADELKSCVIISVNLDENVKRAEYYTSDGRC